MAPKKTAPETRLALIEKEQEHQATALKDHEADCTLFRGAIADSFERVHKRLDGINRATLATLLSLAGSLVIIIGYLIINGVPWAH